MFPTDDMALTHLLVVSDPARSKEWYQTVLGAEVYREYGGTSVVLSFLGNWLLLVSSGGPTPDKPDVSFAPSTDLGRVDHEFTIRVPDCKAAYDELCTRGATFLTPPYDRGGEVRCFFRDLDGHLFEISEVQSTG